MDVAFSGSASALRLVAAITAGIVGILVGGLAGDRAPVHEWVQTDRLVLYVSKRCGFSRDLTQRIRATASAGILVLEIDDTGDDEQCEAALDLVPPPRSWLFAVMSRESVCRRLRRGASQWVAENVPNGALPAWRVGDEWVASGADGAALEAAGLDAARVAAWRLDSGDAPPAW